MIYCELFSVKLQTSTVNDINLEMNNSITNIRLVVAIIATCYRAVNNDI